MFQEEFGLPEVDWKSVSKGELLHILLEDTVEQWLDKRFGKGPVTATVVSIDHPNRGANYLGGLRLCVLQFIVKYFLIIARN